MEPAGVARSARRWALDGLLGTAHLTLDVVWGWFGAVVLLTLLTVGIGLLPVFGLGLVVLAALPLAARWWGAAERARLAAVLGVTVPAPPPLPAGGLLARVRALLSDRTTWGAVAWAVVLPVLGAVEAALVLGLWSAAVALLTEPAWAALAGPGRLFTDLPGAWLLAPVAGLLLVPVTLLAARGLAAVDVAVVRTLLGADPVAPLRQRVEELRATRAGVVDAADAERRRIERDLHDGAQQRLVALAVDLGRASARMDDDPQGARELVVRAHSEAKLALAELRDLARGIHPAVLTDRGLDAALSALAARSPVPVSVDADLGGRCAPTAEATAYFVVSEALTNAAKHSGATRVSVRVHRRGDRLVVSVVDDGHGGADSARGTGLAGLERRVAGADGTLQLTSPDGGPTELVVELPCAS